LNSKQAKALRAGLREFAKVRNPERAAEYKTIEHVKIVTDEEGKRHEVPYARTAVLSPTCPRGLYQRAKRGIKAGGLNFKSGGIHRQRLRSKVLGFLGANPVHVPGDDAGAGGEISQANSGFRQASKPITGIGPSGAVSAATGSEAGQGEGGHSPGSDSVLPADAESDSAYLGVGREKVLMEGLGSCA